MLPKWRLVLRKAQQAFKGGQLDEAADLVTAPDVASYRPAKELSVQIGKAYAKRAEQNLKLGNSQGAWQDLARAERMYPDDKRLDSMRADLLKRGRAEIDESLQNAQPQLACEMVDRLRALGLDNSEFRKLGEAARRWQRAEERALAGKFPESLELVRQCQLVVAKCPALDQRIKHFNTCANQLTQLESELHTALGDEEWTHVMKSVDAVLRLAPQHTAALSARNRAWHAVGANVTNYTPRHIQGVEATIAGESPVQDDDEIFQLCSSEAPSYPPFQIWVDGVGGYLVLSKRCVSIGQPVGNHVDIPLLAEISRLHAWIERDNEGYMLRAQRDARVSGHNLAEKRILQHGDVIELGSSVKLLFQLPNPVSSTARLDIISGHKSALAADGVILLADVCVMGPKSNAHIRAPGWENDVVLTLQRSELLCRMAGRFEANGVEYQDRAVLNSPVRVATEDISFALESVEQDSLRI